MCVNGVSILLQDVYKNVFFILWLLNVLCNSEHIIHHVWYHPSTYFPTTAAVTFTKNGSSVIISYIFRKVSIFLYINVLKNRNDTKRSNLHELTSPSYYFDNGMLS